MAFKTLSRVNQGRAMRRSPPLVHDRDRFQPFSIDFSMKVCEIQELIDSVVFTCKHCCRERSFQSISIGDYVNVEKPFHVFYSFVRKEFNCCCSQDSKNIRYFVDFKFKQISSGQWTLIERERLRKLNESKLQSNDG